MKATILVALDLSDASFAALESASDLAARGEATLHLVHVVERGPLAAPRAKVEAIAEDLREHGFSVVASTREGKPAVEILKLAEAVRPDLIAMGAHRDSGVRYPLLGNVATAVMSAANCPVLAFQTAPQLCRERAA